jgi:hypothetical protein
VDNEEALKFLKTNGIVMASAKGPVPRMSEVIAGEPIKGSWWGHAKGHEIYSVLSFLEDSPDVLVCRLIDGKVTLVHRRLWPALIRVAEHFAPERLVRVDHEHPSSGRHINHETPFPLWADAFRQSAANALAESQASDALGMWSQQPTEGST